MLEQYAEDIPVDNARLYTGSDDGGNRGPNAEQKAKDAEAQAVLQYAKEQGITNWNEAKVRYRKERAS